MNTTIPWSHAAYVAHNDRLARLLDGPAKAPTSGETCVAEAREHLRRARRNGFQTPQSIAALHDAVATMLYAFEGSR
jgi:hypothetical protein